MVVVVVGAQTACPCPKLLAPVEQQPGIGAVVNNYAPALVGLGPYPTGTSPEPGNGKLTLVFKQLSPRYCFLALVDLCQISSWPTSDPVPSGGRQAVRAVGSGR